MGGLQSLPKRGSFQMTRAAADAYAESQGKGDDDESSSASPPTPAPTPASSSDSGKDVSSPHIPMHAHARTARQENCLLLALSKLVARLCKAKSQTQTLCLLCAERRFRPPALDRLPGHVRRVRALHHHAHHEIRTFPSSR